MRVVKRSVATPARNRVAELAPAPDFVAPQLCRLVARAPQGAGWAHEVKFDGYRMHARIAGGEVRLLTRSGIDWTGKYAPVAAALARLKCRQAYLDGELCAIGEDGASSFSALQGHGQKPAPLVYFGFDLLHLDGKDVAREPLLERKARLEGLLRRAPQAVRFSAHAIGEGPRVFEEAARLGLEGIVSKAIDAPYRPGERGTWVKTKALNRQEFVVVGWTDPEGSRPHLGSLLLGYWREDSALAYAGRAGTGMGDDDLRRLVGRLRLLATAKMPLAAPPPRNTRGKPLVVSRVHWVRPELVVEVTVLTWAADGLLRHVVYRGVREDKPARDIRRAG